MRETTCFTIIMMFFLIFLQAIKSTSSMKQVLFEHVHSFIADLVLVEARNFCLNEHCT